MRAAPRTDGSSNASTLRLVHVPQLPHAQLSFRRVCKSHDDAVRAGLLRRGARVIADDVLPAQVFRNRLNDGPKVVLGVWVARRARVAADEELPARALGQLSEALRRAACDEPTVARRVEREVYA